MNKGLFFHCLIISLILHIAVVLMVELKKPKERRREEPIAIDLLGPVREGAKTALPPKPRYRPHIQFPQRMAAASTPGNMPEKAFPRRHFLPSFAAPEPSKTATAPPGSTAGMKVPPATPAGTPNAPRPAASTAASTRRGTPSAQSAGSAGREQVIPRKLKLPTMKDLERYAEVDKEIERTRDPNAVTLDTTDFRYWSYLQGLKNRIEYIWKYPGEARREGIEGELLMRFTIEKSGKVTDVKVLKSSGYPMLDAAAKKALYDASPVNPLPDNWKKNSFTITGNFVYRLYYAKPFVE